ncbi:MAG: ATP-binding cassette domain-containing protein [Acidobacteria bacterium]|nr:ATP-binding cassette domain-containing protein [Acidobacteriota bacterium]
MTGYFLSFTISSCSYSYGRKLPVFRDLSLTFAPGRSVLLGPNGAGKSTLLSLCADVFRPTRGQISLDGLSASSASTRQQYRSSVAWLPQQTSYFPGLNVREHVAYVGWLKGMNRADAWSHSQSALQRVGLMEKADHRAGTLSGGQLRRMGIAGALVHGARVLLLDEPTAGLDPNQRNRFRQLLLDLPDDVHAIVSTHQIEDVHDVFDNIAVLDRGALVYADTVPNFIARATKGDSQPERVANAYADLIEDEA